MRRGLAGAAAAILLAALAGAAVWGVNEERGEAALEARPAAAKQAAVINGEPTLTLSRGAQRNDGVVLAKLVDRPHTRKLHAYGTVIDLQPLTDLDNRYDNAKAQIDIAQAKLDASQTAYQRARALYRANKIISAAQYQTAEASYLVDRATLAAARSQLHSLAVSAVQAWGPMLGRAVVEGKPVVQRLVTRQLVLLQATLPAGERLLGRPKGAVARAADGTLVPLEFVSDAPKTDPRLQGLSFYFTASAESRLLPGMNVDVLVPNGPAVVSAVLPETAVVWEGGQSWAYFKTGTGTFTRRPIATSWPAPGGGYIVPGVANGSEVVTRGAQMLLSDEFRAQTKIGGGQADAGDND